MGIVLVLLVLALVFGVVGFFLHVLWIVAVILFVVWLVGVVTGVGRKSKS